MNISKLTIDRSNLLYHLGILTRRWRQVLDSECRAAGLTDATWRPLLHLHILGDGVRQKDLAASIGIEGPSLVRLIDTLVVKGLIQRSEDGSDRRAKLLRLTLEGQLVVARIREIVTILENQLLSHFSEDDIDRFGRLVLSLEATVNQARSTLNALCRGGLENVEQKSNATGRGTL
ncbi:MAG TPA: transcriptional regulator [Geobacter sp.]|nr:transcriptional regulator [Geobacter sp.]HCE67067.1 transcriptional regulator [Geobacter sp.]